MKKLLALLLALMMLFTVYPVTASAAQNDVDDDDDEEKDEDEENQTVTLSTSNWKNYLHIEIETQNYNSKTTNLLGTEFADGTADCVITVSDIVPCTCSNVVITLEIYSTTLFWKDESKTVDIHVSSNGSANKSVAFASEDSLPGYLESPTFSYRVVSVSGTIQEN